MTLHFQVGSLGKDKSSHCLVGYDTKTDHEAYSVAIPASKQDALRDVLEFANDDPEGYDSYKLNYSQVVKLLRLIECKKRPPKQLEYFVEARALQDHTQ